MSKRRPRRKAGMRRSYLRSYSADLIPVGKRPNPFVMRRYKRALDSVRAGFDEPVRKTTLVDYSPVRTPAVTKPMAERTELLHRFWASPDFLDGIDKYHRILVHDTETLKIYLYFHADHYFFIMQDHVKKKAWMSQDFRDRNRALSVQRAGKLLWSTEVSLE